MSHAEDFAALFPAVYLRFHARRGKERRLTPQTSALLQHLALSGPLTVGEMSAHFDRAQSVISEIVDGLEAKGLLERMRDARDRRRTLVWLTDEAHAALADDRSVLDADRVARAFAAMTEPERDGVVAGMRALIRAAESLAPNAPNAPAKKPSREPKRRSRS